MKVEASDYLVAATLSILRSADNSNLETLDALQEAFEEKFSVQLDIDRMAYLAKLLEGYGFITITNDSYAGNYITSLSSWVLTYRLNKFKESDTHRGILYAYERGETLFERAFSNDEYWEDLDKQIAENINKNFDIGLDGAGEVPASDRIVTLSHNQQTEITEPLDKILTDISVENSIDGDSTLLQIIKGQLKAGRELVLEGCFKFFALEVTLIEALKFLANRYEKEAIGAIATTLIVALAQHIGLMI